MAVSGLAGGGEKCAWFKSLGSDAVVDYKAEEDLVRALGKAAPNGIDVYFDNVGGDHLDAALAVANERARFALCGMIDIYNDTRPTELRYLARAIGARIRMQGFIVIDFFPRMDEFYRSEERRVGKGGVRSCRTRGAAEN